MWILSDIPLTAPLERIVPPPVYVDKNNPLSEDGGDVPELNLLVFQLWGGVHVFELPGNVDDAVTGHHKWQDGL